MTLPTSAQLREKVLKYWFEPQAQAAFAADPAVKSVVFAVAQYWCDEAEDAVHGEIVACSDPNPAWPDCLNPEFNALLTPRGDVDPEDWSGWDALERTRELADAAQATLPIEWLDENGEMIVAFASCTLQGHSQEDDIEDAYTPYAIARRGADGGVAIEVVGAIQRPEWENRWDVGYYAEDPGAANEVTLVPPPREPEPITVAPAPAPAPAPMPVPAPKSWWKRLFG